MIVGAVILLFLLVIGFKCVIVVPPNSAFVVERLGRYLRTLPAGMSVILPFVDRIAYRFALHPTSHQFTDECITHDNIPVRVTSVVHGQIANAERAAYASANAGAALITLVRTRQRKWISERSWDAVRESTRELEVAAGAEEDVDQFGVRLLNVEVKGIERVSTSR